MALTAIQRRTVRKALKTADKYHASKKVKKAAIEAGLTESQLQPLDYGDRDSEGYLQQRPSQGWGSPKQVRNVGYATKQFVTRANPIAKKYGSAGELAQAVQRSATPDYFGKKSAQAEEILRKYDRKGGKGGAKSGTRTVTKTGTVPGKDRSGVRQQLIGQYFQTLSRPSKNDPYGTHSQGDLATLQAGLKGAQDTPSKTVTVKAKVPGSSKSSAGDSTAGKGHVSVAPGANRGGVGIQKATLEFVKGAAARAHGGGIRVTTGTNHNRMTVNGNVSDHWDGHATDIAVPIDSHRGDVIATAALEQAGVPASKARAMAKRGGLYTLNHNGLRIQVIWKTYEGGNHHNHVHIGARPA